MLAFWSRWNWSQRMIAVAHNQSRRARSEHMCSRHFPLRASRDCSYAGGIFQFDRSMIAVRKVIAALGDHCSQLDRSRELWSQFARSGKLVIFSLIAAWSWWQKWSQLLVITARSLIAVTIFQFSTSWVIAVWSQCNASILSCDPHWPIRSLV